MTIINVLKEALALEEAKYQAFWFGVGRKSLQIKTCEEIQYELNRRLQQHPETHATQAYISALQKMIYLHYMNLPGEIAVEMYIQAGRLDALEFAIDKLGNLARIEHEIAKAEQNMHRLTETRSDYPPLQLACTGYLEALLEVKELIQQLDNQQQQTNNK
jgi:hypothetical protein